MMIGTGSAAREKNSKAIHGRFRVESKDMNASGIDGNVFMKAKA